MLSRQAFGAKKVQSQLCKWSCYRGSRSGNLSNASTRSRIRWGRVWFLYPVKIHEPPNRGLHSASKRCTLPRQSSSSHAPPVSNPTTFCPQLRIRITYLWHNRSWVPTQKWLQATGWGETGVEECRSDISDEKRRSPANLARNGNQIFRMRRLF